MYRKVGLYNYHRRRTRLYGMTSDQKIMGYGEIRQPQIHRTGKENPCVALPRNYSYIFLSHEYAMKNINWTVAAAASPAAGEPYHPISNHENKDRRGQRKLTRSKTSAAAADAQLQNGDNKNDVKSSSKDASASTIKLAENDNKIKRAGPPLAKPSMTSGHGPLICVTCLPNGQSRIEMETKEHSIYLP
ncbi:uncharacterized protein LOC111078126 [Drosophila obscura]|uniref:uncharacterized protein LOC111078126 n=1 Tax=Drosophila obscura TaxID=7282 RepID=UPI001BB23C41|nr:uncharacterized protein LOC111078126 [Drosophila obscura]